MTRNCREQFRPSIHSIGHPKKEDIKKRRRNFQVQRAERNFRNEDVKRDKGFSSKKK